MRRLIFSSILFAALLFGATILATVSLFDAQLIKWALALWLLSLALLVLFAVLFRLYQRLLIRTRVTNEVLKEVKYLQERRYEQLADRVDQLSDYMQIGSSNLGSSEAPTRNRPLLTDSPTLEELNERLQRAERRILGKLEDGLLALDEIERNREGLSESDPIESKEAKR